MKARAQQVGGQAKAQAEARLDQQKQGAAERLDRLASSVRAAAGELEQQDDAQLSQYVSRFAGSLGELADNLRSKNVDELMRDLRAIARRNPGLFVAGSVAVGFGLARFARASSQHQHGQAAGWDGESDTMGAWALDGGSSGGYRGSLSSHGHDSMGSAASGRGSSYAAGSSSYGEASGSGSSGSSSASSTSSTGGAARPGLSTSGQQPGAGAPGSSGLGSGLGSGGGSTTPGRTPPTTRGGTQP